ncbi:MAG: hypothetical protein M0Q92_15005, partial [Methanoregula sp.]|nr:hypothetical protein [Methanoregula sp.]
KSPRMPEPEFSSRPGDLPRITLTPEEATAEDTTPGPAEPEPGQGFLLRGMLIMVVGDEAVLPVVHALIAVNQTGNPSDGEIFICPMVTSLEIGNAERSSSAMP